MAVLASLTATSALIAQENSLDAAFDPRDPVLADHPNITASLDRIARGSALWRGEVEAIRSTGRLAVIVTPQQVLAADPRRGRQRAFDNSVLADISLLPGTRSGIAAVVVVNLQLLDELHGRRGSASVEKGCRSGPHPDSRGLRSRVPIPACGQRLGEMCRSGCGERAVNACSIQRENAVRAELGLGRRTDYGLRGLTLGRPSLDATLKLALQHPTLERYGLRANRSGLACPLLKIWSVVPSSTNRSASLSARR